MYMGAAITREDFFSKIKWQNFNIFYVNNTIIFNISVVFNIIIKNVLRNVRWVKKKEEEIWTK